MATEILEEVQLINIISVSEMRLRKNFSVIVSRLSNHDHTIQDNKNKIQYYNQQLLKQIQLSQVKSLTIIQHLKKQIDILKSTIEEINNNYISTNHKIDQIQNDITKNQNQSITKIYQLEEGLAVLKHQSQSNNIKINQLEADKLQIYDEIYKKEDRISCQKITKKVQQLSSINIHFMNDFKLVQHKIQKIQMINEKQQRIQQKKQAEIIKEIDQKIKKQVKLVNKILTNNTMSPINQHVKSSFCSNQQNNQVLTLAKNAVESQLSLYQSHKGEKSNLPQRSSIIFTMQEQQSGIRQLVKSQVQQSLIMINQKLKRHESHLNQFSQTIKKQQTKKQGSNNQSFKDKINQIKPQIVKIWCKLDAIDDKMMFFDKKLQQKERRINDIISQQKQNSNIKLQQKLKCTQTQIFSAVKDIKVKIDTKLNTIDFDNYCRQNQQKLTQINQAINLKSDKLQVKKALLFLQSKIKEIILVISQDQQNQKDALLTKKQIKCMSCDKEIDKFSGMSSTYKQNWDSFPWKEHPVQLLGRFGMTNYGSLSKKLRKLDNKDLPMLKKKNNNTNQQNQSP